MPRHARFPAFGNPTLVRHRTVGRTQCFLLPREYGLYLGLLAELALDCACRVHAYALLPMEVRLLLTPHVAAGESALMKHVSQRYAQAFNRRWHRTGALWDGRFKSSPVDPAMPALQCQRWVELSPVRHGLAAGPAAYRWSSYRANALGEPSGVLSPLERYRELGPEGVTRRLEYRAWFHGSHRADTARWIDGALQGGFAIGSLDFLERLAEAAGRRVVRRRRSPAGNAPLKI